MSALKPKGTRNGVWRGGKSRRRGLPIPQTTSVIQLVHTLLAAALLHTHTHTPCSLGLRHQQHPWGKTHSSLEPCYALICRHFINFNKNPCLLDFSQILCLLLPPVLKNEAKYTQVAAEERFKERTNTETSQQLFVHACCCPLLQAHSRAAQRKAPGLAHTAEAEPCRGQAAAEHAQTVPTSLHLALSAIREP